MSSPRYVGTVTLSILRESGFLRMSDVGLGILRVSTVGPKILIVVECTFCGSNIMRLDLYRVANMGLIIL